MKEVLQIDRAGRVVIPKRLREILHLKSGDKLAVTVRGGAIELRPAGAASRLKRVNGVLVLSGAAEIPPEKDLVQKTREDRIRELTHGGRHRSRIVSP